MRQLEMKMPVFLAVICASLLRIKTRPLDIRYFSIGAHTFD